MVEVEGDVHHSTWPIHKIKQFNEAITAAHEANKYLFVWDK